ncbi:MAG: hypothetical protein KAI24_12215 [Planctomycetes bacterium]|nr:hypothetical protein [Planctomycetota bacterium]
MKLQNVLLFASLAALTACAGQTYQVQAGPMFARARGEMALANSSGFLPPANSLDGNMGLGESEASPFLHGRTDIGKHRVRLHGFYLDTEGSATLNNAYGNIAAGTQVRTSMDFFAIAGNYSYQVLREDHYRVAVGGQLGFYSLDVAARSSGGREEVTTEVLVPMPYVEAEAFLGDFTFGANAGIMAGDLGDANGRYWDIELYSNWQVDERFDIRGGYRYLLLDGYGRASSRDFDADVDVQGLFISAGVRF